MPPILIQIKAFISLCLLFPFNPFCRAEFLYMKCPTWKIRCQLFLNGLCLSGFWVLWNLLNLIMKIGLDTVVSHPSIFALRNLHWFYSVRHYLCFSPVLCIAHSLVYVLFLNHFRLFPHARSLKVKLLKMKETWEGDITVWRQFHWAVDNIIFFKNKYPTEHQNATVLSSGCVSVGPHSESMGCTGHSQACPCKITALHCQLCSSGAANIPSWNGCSETWTQLGFGLGRDKMQREGLGPSCSWPEVQLALGWVLKHDLNSINPWSCVILHQHSSTRYALAGSGGEQGQQLLFVSCSCCDRAGLYTMWILWS